MREIKYIVLHCTATHQSATIEAIQNYWREVLKWKNPGYHWLIKPNGVGIQLHPIAIPSNGVAGFNKHSIHISYIGGIDKFGNAVDNRTNAQKQTMMDLIIRLRKQFPFAEIRGHRDFPGVSKDCPSFDVKEWCVCVGIDAVPSSVKDTNS